jgi:hypothetical protein
MTFIAARETLKERLAISPENWLHQSLSLSGSGSASFRLTSFLTGGPDQLDTYDSAIGVEIGD